MTGYVDHLILGAASYQTDYQVLIRVYRGYGQNSGNAVYIPSSECRSDFSDIRFVDTAGRLLPYWIETTGTNYADIWVKLYQIPTTGAIIKILYGGGSIAAGSSSSAAFPDFFDHFDGSALDATKWHSQNTDGTAAVSNSILTLTAVAELVGRLAKSEFSPPIAMRTNFKMNSDGAQWYVQMDDRATAGSYAGAGIDSASIRCSSDGTKYYNTTRDNSATNSSRTSTLTSYTTADICISASNVIFFENGTPVKTNTTNIPTDPVGPYFLVGSSKVMYVDWVLVRKYAYPEPSHGWWGSLEDL